MKPSVFFSAIEPLHEIPGVCDLCISSLPILSYEFEECGASRESQEKKGFCCARCAVELLRKLEHAEARQWAEEEAALKVDEFDISAFREHRLAAFPNNVQ
jgi:hypothetical protein